MLEKHLKSTFSGVTFLVGLDPTTLTTIHRSFSRFLTIATPGNIAMCMHNTLG